MYTQGGTQRSELLNLAGHGPALRAAPNSLSLHQGAAIFPLSVTQEEALTADTQQGCITGALKSQTRTELCSGLC